MTGSAHHALLRSSHVVKTFPDAKALESSGGNRRIRRRYHHSPPNGLNALLSNEPVIIAQTAGIVKGS